ncbi:hypothetical protein FKP32DRAFT_1394697 [Trametes sanguinea]|nr:hypothetical protein FKP32DRAFT_1394697 [Trametes sanguinea]
MRLDIDNPGRPPPSMLEAWACLYLRLPGIPSRRGFIPVAELDTGFPATPVSQAYPGEEEGLHLHAHPCPGVGGGLDGTWLLRRRSMPVSSQSSVRNRCSRLLRIIVAATVEVAAHLLEDGVLRQPVVRRPQERRQGPQESSSGASERAEESSRQNSGYRVTNAPGPGTVMHRSRVLLLPMRSSPWPYPWYQRCLESTEAGMRICPASGRSGPQPAYPDESFDDRCMHFECCVAP